MIYISCYTPETYNVTCQFYLKKMKTENVPLTEPSLQASRVPRWQPALAHPGRGQTEQTPGGTPKEAPLGARQPRAPCGHLRQTPGPAPNRKPRGELWPGGDHRNQLASGLCSDQAGQPKSFGVLAASRARLSLTL